MGHRQPNETVVGCSGWGPLSVIAGKTVQTKVAIGVAFSKGVGPFVKDAQKGVLKVGLEGISDGLPKRQGGLSKDIGHQNEHDRIARRATVAGDHIDHCPVAKIDLKWGIGAHGKLHAVHFSISLVGAGFRQAVGHRKVEFTSVKAKIFGRQAVEHQFVISGSSKGSA